MIVVYKHDAAVWGVFALGDERIHFLMQTLRGHRQRLLLVIAGTTMNSLFARKLFSVDKTSSFHRKIADKLYIIDL
jgi:hypothetical protein